MFFVVRRGHTLIEVMVAIAILTVVVVFISADMMNLQSADSSTDRSVEVAGADYLLGVMKSDAGFWQNGNDWSSGPSDTCLSPLGPYTDAGPSPAPSWHDMPSPPSGCDPYPFSDVGGPQPIASGGTPAPPIGNEIQYMWNASEHGDDPFAADLTVWVRRDASSPTFEYHAIRYEYPSQNTPTPGPTISPTGSPSPGSPPPSHGPPTPPPSPTPIGI